MKTFLLILTFTVNPAVVNNINGFVAGGGSSQAVEYTSYETCQQALKDVVSHYSQQNNMLIADGLCVAK